MYAISLREAQFISELHENITEALRKTIISPWKVQNPQALLAPRQNEI